MTPLFRRLAFAALCATAGVSTGAAADEALLPAEPTEGEWIADTLEDDSLWFASSGNLAFEDIAAGLTDYPQGRRWVHVRDGKTAWVMYYVPGEILGFEVDTHHYGALATGFRFAVGSTWQELAPIEPTFEEITGFAATWMRLYRTVDALPAGTQFLRIEFPADAEIDAARLTEVWLRCRLEPLAGPKPVAADINPFLAPVVENPSPAAAATADGPSPIEDVVAPMVVTGVILQPPAMPEPDRIFSAADVDPSAPRVHVILPSSRPVLELPPLPEGDVAPSATDAASGPRGLLARVADFLFGGSE